LSVGRNDKIKNTTMHFNMTGKAYNVLIAKLISFEKEQMTMN